MAYTGASYGGTQPGTYQDQQQQPWAPEQWQSYPTQQQHPQSTTGPYASGQGVSPGYDYGNGQTHTGAYGDAGAAQSALYAPGSFGVGNQNSINAGAPSATTTTSSADSMSAKNGQYPFLPQHAAHPAQGRSIAPLPARQRDPSYGHAQTSQQQRQQQQQQHQQQQAQQTQNGGGYTTMDGVTAQNGHPQPQHASTYPFQGPPPQAHLRHATSYPGVPTSQSVPAQTAAQHGSHVQQHRTGGPRIPTGIAPANALQNNAHAAQAGAYPADPAYVMANPAAADGADLNTILAQPLSAQWTSPLATSPQLLSPLGGPSPQPFAASSPATYAGSSPQPFAASSPATYTGSSTRRSSEPSASASVSPTATFTSPIATGKGKGRAGGGGGRGKRAPKRPKPNEESDAEEEDGLPEGRNAPQTHKRPACVNCKKMKIRCDYQPDVDKCPRCRQKGLPCTFEKRKPPRNPNKREYFLQQLKQKDAIIESLLKELYNPYTATPLSARALRERTVPTTTGSASAVQDWLARADDAAKPPLQVPFAFEDDGGALSDGDDGASATERHVRAGSSVPGEGRSTEKDSPVEEAFPIAQMAELRIGARKGVPSEGSVGSAEETAVEEAVAKDRPEVLGIVNERYFEPGPATDVMQRTKMGQEHTQSSLITHGLVTSDDVDELFKLYHNSINAFVPLLDPVLHTPRDTFARCPCLFTVICAITSRYHPEKAAIYPIAMHFALNECANALMHGWKCIELAQAFILLAVYAHPAKRFEEERSYLYGGLAARIAIDLNVNIEPITKPQGERAERELLNRTRLWMICFQTDWQMAAHYGKPSSLKENKIIRAASDFYLRSDYNLVADVHLCAYNELLRHIAGFHTKVYSNPDARTGLKKNMNFMALIEEYDGELSNLINNWQATFAEYTRFKGDPVYAFRCELLPYVVSYTRLIWYSFAFQQAFDDGMKESDRPFFKKCMETAKTVVRVMIERLAPTGNMRFAPNGWFNFSCFSSAFLMKLLRAEFSNMLSKEEEQEIFDLIEQLVEAMGSEKMAIDDRHTPKLWARFLGELLAKHHKDGAMAGLPHKDRKVEISRAPTMDVPAPAVPQVLPSAVQAAWPQAPTMPAQNMPHGTWPAQANLAPAPGLGLIPNIHIQGTGVIQPGGYENAPMMVDDDPTLAMMTVLNNPGFWDNLMLPGFVWPESPHSGAELPMPDPPAQPPVVQSNNWTY